MLNFNLLMFMRQVFFAAVFVAAVCSVSCNKEQIAADVPPEVAEEGKEVEINVSVPLAKTKLTTTDGEDNVETLQVFVFREDGMLDSWSIAEDAASLSIKCTAGLKRIVAIVNAPRLTGITDKTMLDESVSLLDDNWNGHFVMCGSRVETVVGATDIEVEVKHLAARVSIHKITNAMTLEQYREKEFKLVSVFLANVPATVRYDGKGVPTLWYNRRTYTGEMDYLVIDTNINQVIGYGESYEQPHYLYCYPNPTETDSIETEWCPRYTRLVVEMEMDSKIYWYPISIKGIESNHKYEISELKITRLGSGFADWSVTTQDAEFTISVADWEPGISQTVEI